jgi:cobyrinic acid a,c-diamide synthase
MKTIVIAAPHSGCGKTTITAGIIAALRARGRQVQPFKAGPDYIDPGYHTLAAGRTCRNLDSWMLPGAAYTELFARATRDADCAVIEGVMGLYDGARYDSGEGSTAEIAKRFNAAVVVVLDASKVARTLGATALGMQAFDPALNIVGYIANNVAGPGHGDGVRLAIEQATGKPCFGWIARDPQLVLPERHLGLVPTAEAGRWQGFIDHAATVVAQQLDLDTLWQAVTESETEFLAKTQFLTQARSDLLVPATPRPRIAIAEDAAFSFLYPENLELLREAGAELVPFSPLHDANLPAATQGIYLCGGFPELYAAELARNTSLHEDLRAAASQGLPIYAECGGLMYLTEAIIDQAGNRHKMAGLLPGATEMTPRLTMGYRQLRAQCDNWLWRQGEEIRGHEFHYSTWTERPAQLPHLYQMLPWKKPTGSAPQAAQWEGVCHGNVLAAYSHLHFLARPQLATRFVEAARQAQLWSSKEGIHDD